MNSKTNTKKEGYPASKVDHSERNSDFLYEILNSIKSIRLLNRLSSRTNRFLSNCSMKEKLPITVIY